MSKRIISDMSSLNLGNLCLKNTKENKENKAYHFITKVRDNCLNVYGASYAVCHYNGNLPTHEGMGFSSLGTRSLYHFVYKLILIP